MWALLAQYALPTIASIGMQYAFGKPKKESYKYDPYYVDKYIASIRGRAQDREVYQQSMKPMLRTLGRQGEAMRKQGQYAARRGGYAGTGVEAQLTLSREQQQLQAYTQAGEKAAAAQAQETRRIAEQVDKAQLEKAENIAKGNRAYSSAVDQWKQGMIQTGVQGLTNMAVAGIQQKAATAKAAKTEEATAQKSFMDLAKTGIVENTAAAFANYKAEYAKGNFTSYSTMNESLGIANPVVDTSAQLQGHHETYRSEGGQLNYEQWHKKLKEEDFMSGKNFNAWLATTATPTPTYEPPKTKLTTKRFLLDNYKESDILQEIKEDTGIDFTNMDEAVNNPKVDLNVIKRKLKGELTSGKQITSGKEASIQFAGRLNNLKQQIIEATDKDTIAADPEVDRILKDLETTGYVTQQDKVDLHEYAQTLSTVLKPKEEGGANPLINWNNPETGITHKVTGAKVYSQLASEIDDMQIGEKVKKIIQAPTKKKIKKTKVVKKAAKKEEEQTTVTPTPVEETHPEGYDESKGWSMEILGDNRVYTKPDGSKIMTDLEGNVLEKSEPSIILSKPEKEKLVKEFDEMYPDEKDEYTDDEKIEVMQGKKKFKEKTGT